MKTALSLLAIFLFTNIANADYYSCVFKDMGENRDMVFVKSKKVESSKDLTEIQRKQVATIGDPTRKQIVDEIIKDTDDGHMSYSLIHDTAHNKHYEYYSYYAGDTQVGNVFEKDSTNQVAENGDGDFYCDIPYTAYDKLPLYFFKPKSFKGKHCYFGSNLLDLARRKNFIFTPKYKLLNGLAADFVDSETGQVYTVAVNGAWTGGEQTGEIKTKDKPGFVLATIKDGAIVECSDSFWARGW